MKIISSYVLSSMHLGGLLLPRIPNFLKHDFQSQIIHFISVKNSFFNAGSSLNFPLITEVVIIFSCSLKPL